MDKKAIAILKHYKHIIENREFDEYDILSFLIFIREMITKNSFPYIYEFCNFIAHRERNCGIVYGSIKVQSKMKSKKYAYDIEKLEELISEEKYDELDSELKKSFGKKNIERVCNYKGIDYDKWKDEWINLFKELNINFEEQAIKEITICIFSLSQYAIYSKKGKNGKIDLGHMELIQGKDGSLGLCTMIEQTDSKIVCFMKINEVNMKMYFNSGYITEVVETVRENGILKLVCSKGIILEC